MSFTEAYRVLVENSIQGLVIFQNSRIVFANAAMAEIVGYSINELLSLPNPSVLIYPDDQIQVFDNIQRRFAGQSVAARYQYRIVRKDGSVRWLEQLAVLTSFHDKPAIQTAVVDITEQKQLEDKQAQLEELYRILARNLPGIAVMLFDQDLRYQIAEGMALEEAGYSRVEMENRTIWEVLPEDRAQLLAPYYRQALAGMEVAFEYQRHEKTYTVRIVPIKGDEGNITRGLLLSQDITQAKAAEAQQVQLAVARERIEALTSLFRSLSHDLRTPLSVINTSLYLLERITDPAKQKEKLEVISAQLQVLQEIIESVLTLARLDYAPELQLTLTDINPILTAAEIMFRLLSAKKNLDMRLVLDTGMPSILISPDDIMQAVSNILHNAIKYTPQEGSISIRSFVKDGEVVIEISDTGIGIGPEDLPHIFERFYRADKARASLPGGSGMGLTIAQRIILLHHGVIEVESEPGHGSTFRIRLPIDQTEVR